MKIRYDQGIVVFRCDSMDVQRKIECVKKKVDKERLSSMEVNIMPDLKEGVLVTVLLPLSLAKLDLGELLSDPDIV